MQYLLKQSKKKYIKDISNKEAAISKSFWNRGTKIFTKVFKQMKTFLLRQRKMKKQRPKAYKDKVDIRTKD